MGGKIDRDMGFCGRPVNGCVCVLCVFVRVRVSVSTASATGLLVHHHPAGPPQPQGLIVNVRKCRETPLFSFCGRMSLSAC